MKKIGITGAIGSGKTIICRIFEVLGIPVYYADEAAKRLMQHDHLLRTAIREHFGHETYDSNGNLNKAFLAKVVFNDKEKLDLLNSLVHPVTIRDAEQWAEKQNAPYVIKEAALMFESEAFHHVDKVIGVSAPEHLRIKRTMDRDHISRGEVLKRMNNQMEEETKMKMCDYIIYNDEQQAVIPQVLKLHEEILMLQISNNK
ncbi:MAG: dephospho-CoA kinase [Chitinophagaceae bacterium]